MLCLLVDHKPRTQLRTKEPVRQIERMAQWWQKEKEEKKTGMAAPRTEQLSYVDAVAPVTRWIGSYSIHSGLIQFIKAMKKCDRCRTRRVKNIVYEEKSRIEGMYRYMNSHNLFVSTID